MITPRDLHRAQFKRVWKGYNPEEVDQFLRRVVLEYERVYKENQELKEKIEALEERVREYASTETQISLTLDMARQAAADAKSAAEREANAIINEARAQADQILRRTSLQVEEERRRINAHLQEVALYRARLQEALHELMERLEATPEHPGFSENAPRWEAAASIDSAHRADIAETDASADVEDEDETLASDGADASPGRGA